MRLLQMLHIERGIMVRHSQRGMYNLIGFNHVELANPSPITLNFQHEIYNCCYLAL